MIWGIQARYVASLQSNFPKCKRKLKVISCCAPIIRKITSSSRGERCRAIGIDMKILKVSFNNVESDSDCG